MTFWYVNRAAGLVAWALLSASILCGLLLSTKALGRKVRPNWLLDLHRGLSGLAVVFVGVHVVGAVADNYVHFGLADVLVPFASSWRPVAMAWGVVSTYLLLAVEATSLLRKHLSKRAWRAVHFAAFPLFVTATLHGTSAGTEMGTTAGVAVAALVTAAVAGLTAYRVIEATSTPPAAAAPARTRVPVGAPPAVPTYAPATFAPVALPPHPPLAPAEPERVGSPF